MAGLFCPANPFPTTGRKLTARIRHSAGCIVDSLIRFASIYTFGDQLSEVWMNSNVLAVAVLAFLSTFAIAQAPGAAAYKKNCVMCHGASGTGKTKMGLTLKAADLTTNDIQSLSDEALAQTLRNGKGKMPPFEKTLTADEITQVVQYVRTLRK